MGGHALGARSAPKTWAELQPQFLAENDLPFEMCGTSEEALDHPQIIANGEVVEVDDPVLGTVRQVGPVATFAESPSVITRSAPALGADQPARSLVGPRPRRTAAAAPEHALSGVTIVEFGYFYAMPYGVTLAAAARRACHQARGRRRRPDAPCVRWRRRLGAR